MGMSLMVLTARLFFYSNPHKVEGWFHKLQFISSAFISLGHGSNDAQKTMGIIAMCLYSSKLMQWRFSCSFLGSHFCNFVIALGTFFGGWRIVKTMGMKITKLRPVSGFCSDTASAFTLGLGHHVRYSCFHHPHCDWRNYWRWFTEWFFRRALGCGKKYCLGMGVDYSCFRLCCCDCLGMHADSALLSLFPFTLQQGEPVLSNLFFFPGR